MIDDKIPFIKGVLEPYAQVVYLPGGKITSPDAVDADAIITRTRTKCNEQLLRGTGVKIIATATIGYDHIDVGYCNATGIKWVNAPGCNSGSVMQYISSALVNLSRKKGFRLKGKTLGIIGVGNVGSKIARVGKAFDMKVLMNDPPRERVEGSSSFIDLKELLAQSDIVTLHVPLIKEGIDKTLHLIDDNTLSSMKRNAVLLNTSRGEVVETNALIRSLKEKRISGAVIDVWENEPDIDLELLGLVDIATPHIAGYSQDGKANGTANSVQALSRFFGWDLNGWYPSDIPEPVHSLIEIAEKQNQELVIGDAILKTYNIMDDDLRLRANTEMFEFQRGQYPARREFHAYNVNLNLIDKLIMDKLSYLGFKVIEKGSLSSP